MRWFSHRRRNGRRHNCTHPLAATKWARPLLLHVVCSERISYHSYAPGGVGSAKRVFCPWWPWPLTFDLDIQTPARCLYNAPNRQVIVLTNKQTDKLTNKQTPLKTSTSLRYATPVGSGSSSSSSSSRNEYDLGGTIAMLLQDHRTVSIITNTKHIRRQPISLIYSTYWLTLLKVKY